MATPTTATSSDKLTDLQKQIFEAITSKDVGALKTRLAQLETSIDFIDDSGMTPLQHACYKQTFEAVQCILDQVSERPSNTQTHTPTHTSSTFGSTRNPYNIDIDLPMCEVKCARCCFRVTTIGLLVSLCLHFHCK